MATNGTCPVTFNTTLSVQFDVTANTARTGLKWRQAIESGDAINPPTGGNVINSGSATISFSDIVLDDFIIIEIYDDDDVLVRFNLRH